SLIIPSGSALLARRRARMEAAVNRVWDSDPNVEQASRQRRRFLRLQGLPVVIAENVLDGIPLSLLAVSLYGFCHKGNDRENAQNQDGRVNGDEDVNKNHSDLSTLQSCK